MTTHTLTPWKVVGGRYERLRPKDWRFVDTLSAAFVRGRRSRLAGRSKNALLTLADRPRVTVDVDWLDPKAPTDALSDLLTFIAIKTDVIFVLRSTAGIRGFRRRMADVIARDEIFAKPGRLLCQQWIAGARPANVEVNPQAFSPKRHQDTKEEIHA